MPAGHAPPRRVLMIAYHFPPLAGSSGIQRTLRFVQHLPRFGWEPLVLTVRATAYEQTSPDLLADVPAGTVVRRAFALDNARHLSFRGRHVAAWSRPDRWKSWRWDGVRQGLALIDAFAPDAIYSTYPIATAHAIAADLHARTALPWIADFRDPMAQDGYPAHPLTWRSFKAVEERVFGHAAACLFTTPGALRMYRARYAPHADTMSLLENGYDEESFAAATAAAAAAAARAPLQPGALTLLHSGIVYPSERNPTHLFAALQAMKAAGELEAPRLVLRFRAPVHDTLLRALAERHGVVEHVEIVPALAYRDALAEMLRADGLLLLQASNCNDQVPAKAYEYFRARRPVLCLTDPAGDTAAVLAAAGITRTAPLDDAASIRALLRAFRQRGAVAAQAADDTAAAADGWCATDEAITQASRLGRTRALADVLRRVAGPRAVAAGRPVVAVRQG